MPVGEELPEGAPEARSNGRDIVLNLDVDHVDLLDDVGVVSVKLAEVLRVEKTVRT